MKIYSIFDKKVGAYGPVMSFQNEVDAKRYFGAFVVNADTIVGMYPEDYVLTYVGEFDDETGCITADNMPTHVVEALACVAVRDQSSLQRKADEPACGEQPTGSLVSLLG